MMRLVPMLLLLAWGCADAPRMPLLPGEPMGCERLGVVWQARPFPLWNDWRRGLERKAAVLGADTLAMRHRYPGFAMASDWRCSQRDASNNDSKWLLSH